MRLDCPYRGFCNKFTKSILAVGILLLLTGLVFCNNEGKPIPVEAPQTVTKNESVGRCDESSCRRRAKKKKHSPIQTQQRQMKERLSRINQKIEKLKEKRKRIDVR